MVLIDSCVFIALIREGRDIPRALAPLRERHDLVTCGVVRCEVLRGVKALEIRDRLASYLDCFIYAHTLNPFWEEAEELAWKMDRAGKTIPLTDILIATAALQIGAAVLTYDQHFSRVPSLATLNELES